MNAQVSTDKLLEDLRMVVEDAEALLMATAGQAGERIQEARDRAEASVRQARERIGALEQDLAGQARAAAREQVVARQARDGVDLVGQESLNASGARHEQVQ